MLNAPGDTNEPVRPSAQQPKARPLARSFRFVDLCAGIGGFHLGLVRLGGRCVLASEVDLGCRQTYAHAFPSTPLVGDVWELAADPLQQVPEHDVLCAGLPCQPFSTLGRKQGLADARGHLFFAVVAIICARQPRFVILENVRGLASRPRRPTWLLMIRTLRACGYRVNDEPVILSPHQLPPTLGGTPQRRERTFLLAEYVGHDAEPGSLPITSPTELIDGWDPKQWRPEAVLQADSEIEQPERYALNPYYVRLINCWNDLLKRLGAVSESGYVRLWADSFTDPPRIDRATPAWRAQIIRKNAAFYREHRAVLDDWLAHSGIRSIPPSRRQLSGNVGPAGDLWQRILRLRQTGLWAQAPTWFPTLLTSAQEPIVGWLRRRITPREAARLQGFPDDFQLPVSDRAAYRQLGNAVHPAVVAYLAEKLFGATFRQRASADESAHGTGRAA